MIFNLFEIFLKFLLSNTLRIQTFDKLLILILILHIVPGELMVENFGNSCQRIGCRKNWLVKPHIYSFCIFLEVPVLVTISVFTQHTCPYANLERFFIHFVYLGLLALNLIFDVAKLVSDLVLLLF